MKKILAIALILSIFGCVAPVPVPQVDPQVVAAQVVYEQNLASIDLFWNQEKAMLLDSLSQQFKMDIEIELQNVVFSPDYKVALLTLNIAVGQTPLACGYLIVAQPVDEWVFAWATVRYVTENGSL